MLRRIVTIVFVRRRSAVAWRARTSSISGGYCPGGSTGGRRRVAYAKAIPTLMRDAGAAPNRDQAPATVQRARKRAISQRGLCVRRAFVVRSLREAHPSNPRLRTVTLGVDIPTPVDNAALPHAVSGFVMPGVVLYNSKWYQVSVCTSGRKTRSVDTGFVMRTSVGTVRARVWTASLASAHRPLSSTPE